MKSLRASPLGVLLVVVVCAAVFDAAVAPAAPPPDQAIAANLRQLGARWGDNGYSIPSSSMEPTLHCARPAVGCEARVADRILVRPYAGANRPRRGDIVAFHTPPATTVRCGTGGTFVKRVIGLPGDAVHEANGIISINGKPLTEPYIRQERRDLEPPRRWRVPANQYFLVGDNRAQSCDSRVWGSVPRRNIIGKATGIYWPQARLGRL